MVDIDGRRVKLQIWDTAGQASRLARLSRNQGGELYLITTRHVGCGAKLFRLSPGKVPITDEQLFFKGRRHGAHI